MSVPLAADAPQQYVVKKGDTLWDIAGVFLRDPWYWPEIWYVNPEIQNPHLIYPGDVLNLVWVDGRPRVTVGSSGATRLSPQVRTEPLKDAIRAIPYDLLMDFVGRPSLLDRSQVRDQPHVVGMRDRHLVGSTAERGLRPGPRRAGRRQAVHDGERGRRAARSGRRRPARLHRSSRRHRRGDPDLRRRGAGRDLHPQDAARGRAHAPARARDRPRDPPGRQAVPDRGGRRRGLRAFGPGQRGRDRAGHRRRGRRVRRRALPGAGVQSRQAPRARTRQRTRRVRPGHGGPRQLRRAAPAGCLPR